MTRTRAVQRGDGTRQQDAEARDAEPERAGWGDQRDRDQDQIAADEQPGGNGEPVRPAPPASGRVDEDSTWRGSTRLLAHR